MNNCSDKYSIMSTIDKMMRRHIEFLNSGTFKQNSTEWTNSRRYSVGCSELYDACSTPKMRQNLVQRKINSTGNLNHLRPIIWGNVFESSARLVASLIFNTTIHEFNGGIKHKNGVNTCSPDGVGLIRLPLSMVSRIFNRHVSQYAKYKYSGDTEIFRLNSVECIIPGPRMRHAVAVDNSWQPPVMTAANYCDEMELVALFEFKCPFSKEPQHTKIHEPYLFQVLGGTEIMHVSLIGLLFECWFSEVCAFSRLTDRIIEDPQRQADANVYFAGLKFIDIRDVKCITMTSFELEYVKGKKFSEEYICIDGPYIFACGDKVHFYADEMPDNPPQSIEEFNIYCDNLLDAMQQNDEKPNHYLKFELDQFTTKYVPRLEGFIDCVKPYCDDIIKCVQEQQ